MRFKKWGSRPQRSFPLPLKKRAPVLSGKKPRAIGKRSGHSEEVLARRPSAYDAFVEVSSQVGLLQQCAVESNRVKKSNFSRNVASAT